MNLVFAAILFFLTDANMDAGVGEIAVGEMLKRGAALRQAQGDNGVRDAGYGIRDTGCGIRDTGCGIRDSGYEMRDSG